MGRFDKVRRQSAQTQSFLRQDYAVGFENLRITDEDPDAEDQQATQDNLDDR